MTLPTVALAQETFPTTTVSGNTFHATFSPTGLATAGYVILLTAQWSTTSRTVSTIVSSPADITWTALVPAYIPPGQSATAMFLGLCTTKASNTVTITLSGTPGTTSMLFDELLVSGLPSAPSWTTRYEGTNSNPNSTTKTTPALTPAAAFGHYGDLMYSTCIVAAANLTASDAPLAYLAYNVTDQNVLGIIPTDTNPVPQSGFTLSAADDWTMPTVVLNSGVVPEPARWVPQGVNLGVF